jgi:glucan phosphorylase
MIQTLERPQNNKDIVSLECGLHHSLLDYAGGLGFFAADHINECSIAVSGF